MGVESLGGLSAYRSRYDYTAYLSRRDWAYEYLRRVPEFQKAAWSAPADAVSLRTACHGITILKLRAAQPEAEVWGLQFFPNPELAAPRAHVFWTYDAFPDRIRINVSPKEPGEVDRTFQKIKEKCRMIHLTDANWREHLVVQGKGCSNQTECSGLSLLTSNPIMTSFDVRGVDHLPRQLKILEQSTKVYGDHITSPPTFSRKARLMRNGLIALDGRRAGLSDRKIAWIIEGKEAVEAGLEAADRSLVLRVRKYRDAAQRMCDGGFRELLNASDRLISTVKA